MLYYFSLFWSFV